MSTQICTFFSWRGEKLITCFRPSALFYIRNTKCWLYKFQIQNNLKWSRHLVVFVAIMCISFFKEVYLSLCLALEMRKGKEKCHARSVTCQRGTKRTWRAIQLHCFLLRQVQSRAFRRLVYCLISTEEKGFECCFVRWMLTCVTGKHKHLPTLAELGNAGPGVPWAWLQQQPQRSPQSCP